MDALSPTPQQKEISLFIRTAITASVCFLLVHLMLIFRFAPFGDEVWDLSGECWGIYLAGGRYTVTLFRIIFSDCGVPVAYGITSSLFFGLAVAIQMKILRIENVWNQFIFTGFTVSCIPLSYLMVVCYHADAILFGLFTMSLAFWMYERYLRSSEKCMFFCSIILAALGMGAYQFLGLLLPCFFLLSLLINRNNQAHINLSSIFMKVCHFSLWCLLILGLYYALASVGKLFCHADDLSLTSSYQNSLIMWGKMGFFTNILHIGKHIVLHLLGLSYPGEWIYLTTLLPLFLLLKDIWTNKKSGNMRGVYVLIAIAIYLIPFMPLAVLGTDRGAKCYLAQPLACAAIWSLAIYPRIKHIKPWVAASVSVFIMLKASYVVSDMAFYQKRLYEQSLVVRAEIVSRALKADVPEGVDINTCPIVTNTPFVSQLHRDDKYGNTVPTPGNNPLESYLGLSGVRKIKKGDPVLTPVFEQMEVYPKTGSIKYHEGNILIRLR